LGVRVNGEKKYMGNIETTEANPIVGHLFDKQKEA